MTVRTSIWRQSQYCICAFGIEPRVISYISRSVNNESAEIIGSLDLAPVHSFVLCLISAGEGDGRVKGMVLGGGGSSRLCGGYG